MVITFLQSDDVTKALPLLAKNDNLTDVLWKASAEMKEAIFGMKYATKYNCDCLFLQLIASKLIKLEKRNEGLTWVITRSRDKHHSFVFHHNFLDPKQWVGFNFITK